MDWNIIGANGPCPYCGNTHDGIVCPRIKKISFDGLGSVTSIESHPVGKEPPIEVPPSTIGPNVAGNLPYSDWLRLLSGGAGVTISIPGPAYMR